MAKKIIADKIVSGWKLAGSVTGVTDINSTQISYPSAATELLIHGYIFGGNTFYFQFPIVLAPIGNGDFYIPQSQFIDSENYTNMVFRINNTSSKYVRINSHTEMFLGGGYPPSGIYVWVYYK